MFKSGIHTYAPLHRNSVANYPDESLCELSMIFPEKDCPTLQKKLNDDMLEFVKFTNILRIGDILDVDPLGIDYHFINPDDPVLTNTRVMVVDMFCGVAIFKDAVDTGTHVGNLDQWMTLKEYANQNLAKVYKDEENFSIDSNVRIILKIYIEDIETGVRYWFNLDKNSPFKIIRRTKIGDEIDGKKIKDIIPNYLMIEDEDHWKFVNDNISHYRDILTNSYRCSWELEDGSYINIYDKVDDKVTPHVECRCIDKEKTRRKICGCMNDENKDNSLIGFFSNLFIYE